jgi:hypothetical protein
MLTKTFEQSKDEEAFTLRQPNPNCLVCQECDCSDCLRRDTYENSRILPAEELGCLSCSACSKDMTRVPTQNCEEHLTQEDWQKELQRRMASNKPSSETVVA